MKSKGIVAAVLVLAAGGAAYANDTKHHDRELRAIFDGSVRYTDAIEFPQFVAGDVDRGRAQFGVSADGTNIDTSQAHFEGNSVISGQIVWNGRVCATCHDPRFNFLMPPRPLADSVPADDPLRTGETADAQGDPREPVLFETQGLLKQRLDRFNPLRSESDPFRKLFSWRKTQTIKNFIFNYGLLTAGNARHGVEQARGAAFAHTQPGDGRFDDLVPPETVLNNIVAWEQTQIDPPELKALLDPSDPNHDTLVNDPFATVHPSTDLERKGEAVFAKNCMGCHNMPNVFTNRDHVNGPPQNFMPLYGHTFDVGVGEANYKHLDFRYYDAATGQYSTLVVPLIRQDGSVVNWSVTNDIGAAAATGRYEDLYKFKVPQLRRIKDLGPYFHDNSAATLEDVLDHFNSDAYNKSEDGRKYPIHVYGDDRAALLAFLRIL